MKSIKETRLKITIKGEDIKNLKSAIDKVVIEQKAVGFKSDKFSDEEKEVLVKFSKNIDK